MIGRACHDNASNGNTIRIIGNDSVMCSKGSFYGVFAHSPSDLMFDQTFQGHSEQLAGTLYHPGERKVEHDAGGRAMISQWHWCCGIWRTSRLIL